MKKVIDIFVEIGMGKMDYYKHDFEVALLEDTTAYYSRRASNWIIEDSCPDYLLKVCFICFCCLVGIPMLGRYELISNVSICTGGGVSETGES